MSNSLSSNPWTVEKMFLAMPPQKLTRKQKEANDNAWGKQCVNALVGISNSRVSNGRSTWERKQINYNLINSIVDKRDFSYILNPYGLDKQVGNQPAKLRCNNLIANKVNRILGEEMARPLDLRFYATNGGAVDRKDEWEYNEILKFVEQQFWSMLGSSPEQVEEQGAKALSQINQALSAGQIDEKTAQEQMANIEKEVEEKKQELEEKASKFESITKIKEYKNSTLQDVAEEYATHIYNYLKEEVDLEQRFNDGLFDVLACSEECFYVGIVNGNPVMRKTNPVNLDFDRNPDNPWIQDGDWVTERRMLTKGQVLDEFHEFLSDKQVKLIDEGSVLNMYGNGAAPGFAFPEEDYDKIRGLNNGADGVYDGSHYIVTHVCWKSMKKIGFLTIINPETGEELTDIVADDFKMPKELKPYAVLEWRWMPEVWEGVKIGDDVIVNIKPCENQNVSLDNPSKVKLPYVGRVFGSVNSEQTSFVDLLKPFQYLIDITWRNIEMEMAKNKGKKIAVDTSLIDSSNMTFDEWMYYFDNVGIIFYNGAQEGIDGHNQAAKYNGMTALDASMSQSVGQMIEIINKLEMSMDRLVGIGPQAEGQIQPRQNATSTVVNVTNSNYILEPIYYRHNEVKRKVVQQLIETSKYAWEGSKKLSYMTSEFERVTTEMNMNMLLDTDLGVFATNSAREREIIVKLEQYGQMALSNQSATLSDMVDMVKSNSISEISKHIKQSELEAQERASQAQQAENQKEMEILKAQQDFEREKLQFEAGENEKDRQKDLNVAQLRAMGFSKAEEGEDPAESDKRIIEEGRLAIEQSRETNRFINEQQKQIFENKKHSDELSERDKDRQLKREEMKSKERIEKTKLKNPVVGEKPPKK